MTIYVDADACPVRDETIRVAGRFGATVVMVSNGGIRPRPEAFVEVVTVPKGPDEADRWIAERIGPGDVCVTQDILLAARAIERGATAVRPDGEVLSARNIGGRLAMRDLMADLRAANPFETVRSGGGFSPRDRSRFLEALDRLLRATRQATGGGPAA
jgi:uncharacterized protein YaiI (UPF0178 family)